MTEVKDMNLKNKKELHSKRAREYYKNHKEHCRECHKKWLEKNPNYAKEHHKQWAIINAEHLKEYMEKWEEANPEHNKIWYQNNKEKKTKQVKEWYENNREKMSEYNKEYQREWIKTEKGRACGQRHSVARKTRMREIINTLTSQEWLDILEEYNYRCVYCGCDFGIENMPTRDHIIPISKEGDNIKENIIPSCRSCNSRKGNKILLIPGVLLNA